MKIFSYVSVAMALALIAFTQESPVMGGTRENLQTAFQAESKDRDRYLAFGGKADQEGYGEVASLFRAAARADETHAAHHSAVITKMGGAREGKVETPVVNSTKENIETAINAEWYERNTMYPEFVKQARAEGNKDALETFSYAKSADKEHLQLYIEVLNNLQRLKSSKAKTYYVCTICGYTTANVNFSKCPFCSGTRDQYEKVR